MLIEVKIPSVLREFAQGRATVELDLPGDAASVTQILGALAETCVGVRDRTVNEHGELREHVNVFVNADSIRDLDQMETKVSEGDKLSIIPAVSGGGHPRIFSNSSLDTVSSRMSVSATLFKSVLEAPSTPSARS